MITRRIRPFVPRVGAVLLVVAVLAGCSSSSSGKGAAAAARPAASSTSTTGASTTTTGAGSPAAGPTVRSAGCTKPPEPKVQGRTDDNPDVLETVTSSGVPRTYRLEVPKGDPNTAAHPLLLNLHGSGSNALEQAAYTQFPARAGAQGYVVVTPDAINNNWGLFTPGDTKAADAVLATDLLDSIESRFCIDTNRVYASGISLGAAYSADLACSLPRRIAAVGLVAVEVTFQPCPRTLPVLAFHGTKDPVVPYEPGKITDSKFRGAASPGTAANMAKWAALDRCRPQPAVTTPSSEIQLSVWKGCANQSEVILYTVLGGGHTWPGSPVKIARLGMTTDQVDATGLILEFFARHPLTRGTT